ncbi:MAG TPA: glycerol-3-phosphate 1-O-acyltransferase PlsY [Vulgatibacter sp.]|nr:glycerol-3-phosphate 1-O-acyltransferase PlsY [Vulgatibacter sp.]
MPVLLAIGAYLLGSIPFGLVIAKAWARTDVRRIGSGNIGATNVARAAGKGAALVVLALDAGKGLGPTLLAARLLGPDEAWSVASVGLAAFAGHCFPPWLGFRGGKGVATALGVSFAIAPLAALAGAIVYAAVYLGTRLSSLGSLCAAAATAGLSFVTAPGAFAWSVLAMVSVIFARHRANIGRLVRGVEPKL